jgi:hypothetical protein
MRIRPRIAIRLPDCCGLSLGPTELITIVDSEKPCCKPFADQHSLTSEWLREILMTQAGRHYARSLPKRRELMVIDTRIRASENEYQHGGFVGSFLAVRRIGARGHHVPFAAENLKRLSAGMVTSKNAVLVVSVGRFQTGFDGVADEVLGMNFLVNCRKAANLVQKLIAQGGAALAHWLTTNFSNVFRNSLAAATGQQVAGFFRDQLFKQQTKCAAGPAKVDAHLWPSHLQLTSLAET